MSEIVTKISGQVVVDLCATLGVPPKDVYRIQIDPRGLVIVHSLRRNQAGKSFLTFDDVARQHTDVRIDWSGVEVPDA